MAWDDQHNEDIRVAKEFEARVGRWPYANPRYDPREYDELFAEGHAAALDGKPRDPTQPRPPNMHPSIGFWYSYDASCWLDGYDSALAKARRGSAAAVSASPGR
ncbi:hypothetical protein HY480_01070 [Candidatus Uhrbacteria bacterium]|nr:hypothetical protein [Candidatus Uhrbacteria bacterium]